MVTAAAPARLAVPLLAAGSPVIIRLAMTVRAARVSDGRWTPAVAGLAVAAALATLAALALPASAGPPGRWTQISHFTSRVGLARAKDGTLHVLWAGPLGIPYTAVYDTTASPSGAVGQPRAVLTGWKAVNPPAAAVAPDGSVLAIVSGARTDSPQDPTVGLNAFTGPGTWKLGAHAFGCCNAANADVGAAVLSDGQPVTVWVSASRLHLQVGVDPATQPPDITPPGFASNPSVVVDQRSGDAVIAYHGAGGGGHGGDYFRRVVPSLGPPKPIGAGNVDVPMIAARAGGGVYGAVIQIPNWTKVWLVRYGGAARAVPLPKGAQAFWAGVAAGPEGRMWVYAADKQHVYVTRTNKHVNAYEPVQTLTLPPGNDGAVLQGEGSAGPLDLVGLLTYHGAKDGAWHTQVLPALSLAAAKAKRGATVRVSVRVVDAGDPVAGARVSGLPGGAKTTDASGSVVLTVPATRKGSFALTATKAGYVAAKGQRSL